MENLDNIKKTNNKKTSHIHQLKQTFSSRFEEVLHRKPEILNAFWQKWRLDKCENPDRVQEILDDDWNKCLKISVKPWDKKERNRKALQRWTERAEIQQHEKLDYGEEYVQNLSFQIPKDFALCPRRTVICQWKRSPELTNDDAPLLSLRIKKIDGEYYLVLTDWYREELVPRNDKWITLKPKDIEALKLNGKIWKELTPYIPINDIIWEDVNLECKTKFSDEWESEVCIKIWENKLYEWPITIPTKKSEKAQVYFKFGLYRDCYKHAIRKIKKDKILKPEEKKVQIEEIKKVQNIEREKDSYILLKNYSMKKY